MDIVKIEAEAARTLRRWLAEFSEIDLHTVRVALGDGQVKIKLNDGPWTSGVGEVESSGRRVLAALVGRCYCGCGQVTSARAHWASGHDARAVGRVVAAEFGDSAAFVVAMGYGPDRKALPVGTRVRSTDPGTEPAAGLPAGIVVDPALYTHTAGDGLRPKDQESVLVEWSPEHIRWECVKDLAIVQP